MKTLRLVSSLALAAAALGAHAVTIVLNAPTVQGLPSDPTIYGFTVSRPTSGLATYVFSGTITFAPGERFVGFRTQDLFSAGLQGGPDANSVVLVGGTSALSQYETGFVTDPNGSQSYTGDILSFRVSADTPLETYQLNEANFSAGRSGITIEYDDPAGARQFEQVDYEVNVLGATSAVPGPMAALPFALMALRRRKRA